MQEEVVKECLTVDDFYGDVEKVPERMVELKYKPGTVILTDEVADAVDRPNFGVALLYPGKKKAVHFQRRLNGLDLKRVARAKVTQGEKQLTLLGAITGLTEGEINRMDAVDLDRLTGIVLQYQQGK